MVGQRTRTGCKTCRARKLKCDETKPVCGQCRKSNRECVPSEGVAFRHAQNAGFNDQNGGESLKSFYKYRQKFENPYFVPIPKELTFIQISDPFAEEQVMSPPTNTSTKIAARSASSVPMSYAPRVEPGYVDVAASSLKAMIDPNLESGTAFDSEGHDIHHHQDGHLEAIAQVTEGLSTGQEIPEAESEALNEKIMKALQHSNEQVRQS